MPVTDAILFIHGTGTSAYGPITNNSGVLGDALCTNGSAYSNLELDFGAPQSATSYPYIGTFPSLAEKGYTFPPEIVGDGGVEFGLHIQIEQAFAATTGNSITSIQFQVCTGATSGALYSNAPNPIAARTLSGTQLAVAGAHYFVPVNMVACLEFVRFYAALTGSNAYSGTLLSWLGPKTGGEQ